MPPHVILHHAGDIEIAVVVPFEHAELQRLAPLGRRRDQRLRLQQVEELVLRRPGRPAPAPDSPARASAPTRRAPPSPPRPARGRPRAACAPSPTASGWRSARSPTASGRSRATVIAMVSAPCPPIECPVIPCRSRSSGSSANTSSGSSCADVVPHPEVRRPGRLRRVDVEPGPLPEVVGRVVGDALAARRGVGEDHRDPLVGRPALRAGLGHRVLVRAGQPRQVPEHRHLPVLRLRRQVDREGHLAAAGLGGVAVDALHAAEGRVLRDVFIQPPARADRSSG